jgi:hypothetical protein
MQDRTSQVDENSCNARPDHTSGSFALDDVLNKAMLDCDAIPERHRVLGDVFGAASIVG